MRVAWQLHFAQTAIAAIGVLAVAAAVAALDWDDSFRPSALGNATCVGLSCAATNRTVTVATARVVKKEVASVVTARAPSTPTVAVAAAPVLTTQTANAAAVPQKTQIASAMNADAAPSSPLHHMGVGTEMSKYNQASF